MSYPGTIDDFPIEALVAIVSRETVIFSNEVQHRDGLICDPITEAFQVLVSRFESARANSIKESANAS